MGRAYARRCRRRAARGAPSWPRQRVAPRGPRVWNDEGRLRPGRSGRRGLGAGQTARRRWARRGKEDGVTTVEEATATPVDHRGDRGRPRRRHPAPGQLVGPAPGHRHHPDRLRGLLDLGGLREQELLRRRLDAPEPPLALLLALPRRELRARAATPSTVITWWTLSPALLILIFPLGLPAHLLLLPPGLLPLHLALARPTARWPTPTAPTRGETRFPLILQNVHRWFFYFGLIFNVILTIDAIEAFRHARAGHRGERGHPGALRQRRPAVALHACRATRAATCAAARSRASPSTPSATGSGRWSARSTPTT